MLILYIIFFIVKNIIGDYMEKKDYIRIVNRHKPKENRIINSIIAFLVGGFIGVLAVLISDIYYYLFDISYKDATTFMLLSMIVFACLSTALGFFDKWVTFAKCGLIIPITGFAHSVMSAGLDYKHEGPIYGVGSNMLKLAGSVIIYGIVSAVIFGSIRYIGGLL